MNKVLGHLFWLVGTPWTCQCYQTVSFSKIKIMAFWALITWWQCETSNKQKFTVIEQT